MGATLLENFPNAPDHSNKIKSNEFLCCAFSHRKEEVLVALAGEPEWQVILIDWERSRILAMVSLNLSIPAQVSTRTFQISFNSFDRDGSKILLTGPNNTYKYLQRMQNSENELSINLESIERLERTISDNFVCHAWS